MTHERIAAVIPARLASTRLPGKMLRLLLEKPLLQWTVEAAQRCARLDRIVVATDSDEIGALCTRHGWEWQMTRASLPSGTDRMHAVAQTVDADIYVNLQGDEPLLRPEHVDALLAPVLARRPRGGHHGEDAVYAGKRDESERREGGDGSGWTRPVLLTRGHSLRPRRRGYTVLEAPGPVCVPARGAAAVCPPAAGALEQVERLEQLRLLENGMALYVEPVAFDTVGVDTEDDLLRVEALLRRSA